MRPAVLVQKVEVSNRHGSYMLIVVSGKPYDETIHACWRQPQLIDDAWPHQHDVSSSLLELLTAASFDLKMAAANETQRG